MADSVNVDRTRVLVVAPYPTARAGLRAVVESDRRFEVAGEADGVEMMVPRLEVLAPRVVLLDPGADLDAALNSFMSLSGANVLPPIVLIAQSIEAAVEVVESGVQGVLLPDATAEEIVSALHAVLAGLTVLDSRAMESLIEHRVLPDPPRQPEDEIDALTPREHEVLQLIAQGLPNKTIAAELGISEHTVKFHVGSILAKLEASSRAEALARAARRGLIVL